MQPGNDSLSIATVEVLQRMSGMADDLPYFTKSADRCGPVGGDPNSTASALGLVQQLLEGLVMLQGVLVRELVEQPAKRRPGRPAGSRNKAKLPKGTKVVELRAPVVPTRSAPLDLDGNPLEGEWIGDIFVPVIKTAHGKRAVVIGGKVSP